MRVPGWTLMRFIQHEFGRQYSIIVHEHCDTDRARIFISAYKTPAMIGDLSFHDDDFIPFRARIHK